MPTRDDVHGNGTSNGAPRRPKSRRRAPVDDQPRGFEPDRMRRLWSDIDSARDNLGLGPEAIAGTAAWSVPGIVGYAAGLALDAAGALATRAADLTRACTRAIPDPRRIVGAAVPCMRRLPLVGEWFA